MTRAMTMTLAALTVTIACTGCVGRMIKEGMGAATGASGKVVDGGPLPDLSHYRAVTVEPVTVATDIRVPPEMSQLVQAELTSAAVDRGLALSGQPALTISGEIIHYETAGMVDTAIGPLAEVIVRTRLTDAGTGKIVGTANLIGRSKATVSSGAEDLADGVGKALSKWLKEAGIDKPEGNK